MSVVRTLEWLGEVPGRLRLLYQRAVRLLDEARDVESEDREMCRRIGEHGARLMLDGIGVLTHCNAGALATAGAGTALSPIYVAHGAGRRVRVFADETRPLLQG